MKLYIVKLNCFDTDKKMVKLCDTVGNIKIFFKRTVDFVAKKKAFNEHENDILLILWAKK